MKSCSHQGCDRARASRSNKYCKAHSRHIAVYGKTRDLIRHRTQPYSPCKHSGCGREGSAARGYCNTHYKQFMTYGETRPIGKYANGGSGKCRLSGCARLARVGELCGKHHGERVNRTKLAECQVFGCYHPSHDDNAVCQYHLFGWVMECLARGCYTIITHEKRLCQPHEDGLAPVGTTSESDDHLS